jgi:hypothetical protein
MNKICKRCQTEKPIDEFGNNKNEKDGKKIYCRECELKRGKEYREKNRELINQKSRDWRKQNPEKYKKTIKKYLDKNPHMSSKERTKKYRENEEWRKKFEQSRKNWENKNIEQIREQRKKYYHDNKEKLRKINNQYKNNKLKKDAFFRMKKNLSDRIRRLLMEKKGGKKTLDIVGLNSDNFRNYIEKLFSEGMTWDNYGSWHLDHIRPICLAKTEEEILKYNHYTNLQPLWAEDNLKKNKKI